MSNNSAEENAGEEIVFRGPLTDYWSYSQARDYILVHPGLGHSMLRLYMLLRSMINESKKHLPGAGLRRMSIDQLCWLLPGPNDKPTSVSTMYQLLAGLEELDLVVPDGEYLEAPFPLKPGEKKPTSKEKAARGILRGYIVQDLPPAAYTGWRNVWDKLDAYTPDWRENPPQPPTHITEFGEPDARGRRIDCVRRITAIVSAPAPEESPAEPFQKTGTPSEEAPATPEFQKTGTVGQKTGTLGQKTGPDLPPTSENALPKEAPQTSSSLSSDTSVTQAPAQGAEERAEREIEAASTTAVAIDLPVQREAEEQQASEAQQVLAAYEEALGGPALPSVRAKVLDQATELLAVRPLWWLIDRARELPQWGKDLEKHCANSRVPFIQVSSAGQPDPGKCPVHPVLPLDCPSCRREQIQAREDAGSRLDIAGVLAELGVRI